MYQYTSEVRAAVLARDALAREPLAQNNCTSHRVISVENGQHYGKDGHIPCDHYCIFEYGVRKLHGEYVETAHRTFTPRGVWLNGIVIPGI